MLSSQQQQKLQQQKPSNPLGLLVSRSALNTGHLQANSHDTLICISLSEHSLACLSDSPLNPSAVPWDAVDAPLMSQMPWVLVNRQASPPWLGSFIFCSSSLSCLYSQPSLPCGISERSPVWAPWRLCYAEERNNWFTLLPEGCDAFHPDPRSLLSPSGFWIREGSCQAVGASITATPFLAQPLEAFQRIALRYSKPSQGRGWGRVWCSGLMTWSLNFPKGTGRSAGDACS